MTVPEQPTRPQRAYHLTEQMVPLLMITLALSFAAILGIPIALQGKIRFLFSYWQCFPCMIFLLSAFLIAKKTALQDSIKKIKLAAFALLTLSPFPTWAVRSNGNAYLELCSVACLAAAIWMQMEICQWLQKMGEKDGMQMLALSAKKTQFLFLCFSIIPLSALYVSGLLGLHTGNSRSLQDVMRIWSYGRLSMIMKVFLYWNLLQFTTLCMSATCMAARQMKKTLEIENLEKNERTPL